MFAYLVLFILCSAVEQEAQQDPDFSRNIQQLITSKGYPFEQHWATTPDGYILGLQRIPAGRSGSAALRGPKPVVFLQHGLLDSSVTWVLNNAQQSLGFILADQGFDVWLGNNRGNLYSRNHTKLSPNNPTFWQFTWDELAKYDVPTFIDYVLKKTGSQKLAWVGHSRGTQQMFAALPNNQQLASKLKIFVALAPVAFLQNLKSPLMQFLAAMDTRDLLDALGIHEFLPAGASIDKIIPILCTIYPNGCDDLGFLLFGCCDAQNFNQTRLPVYWNHIPAGTSSQEMAHYAQGVHTGGDYMYDFGRSGNIAHYGQPTPPAYDPSKIPSSLPIAMFSGSSDILADPTDVTTLSNLISKSIVYSNIQPGYTHMDYTWGTNAYKDIYPRVIQLLKNYIN